MRNEPRIRIRTMIMAVTAAVVCPLFLFIAPALTGDDGLQTGASGPARPELVIQNGHSSYVTSIAFDPDGKFFMSGSDDKTVKLWSAEGVLFATYPGHSATVRSVAFGPDGDLMVSGSDDRTVRLWRRSGGRAKSLTGHAARVTAVACSGDGRLIASGSDNKTIIIWSAGGSLLKKISDLPGGVKRIAFSPDSKYLVSGTDDGKLTWWDTQGVNIRRITAHSSEVSGLAFTGDGKHVVSAGMWDGGIAVWDREGKPVRTIPIDSVYINGLSISPGGSTIAAGGDKTIYRCSLDGTTINSIKAHEKAVYCVAWSGDGSQIVSGSHDATIKIWNNEGVPIRTIQSHSYCVNSVAMSRDGRLLAVGSDDPTVKLWTAGNELEKNLDGHTSAVFSVAFNHDGSIIASGSNDTTVRLWSAEGALLRTLKDHANPVYSVVFSPDGKYIAAGSIDGAIYIWSIDGKVITGIKGNAEKSQMTCLAFSPDGKLLCAGINNELVLMSVGGKKIRTFPGHKGNIMCVAFSPDGRILASGSYDATIKLWSVEGDMLDEFRGHRYAVNSLSFSPDGTRILSGSYDKTMLLWTIDGTIVRAFTGHSGHINAVAYSPDGGKIISGSADTTVKVWDAETTACLATLIGFEEGPGLVSTPDGRFDYSHAGAKFYVSYIAAGRYIEISEIFNDFYTPGLWQMILQGTLDMNDQTDINRRLENPALVKLHSPNAGSLQRAVDQSEVILNFSVIDGGGGIDGAEVRTNGKIVWQGRDLKDYRRLKVPVALIQGWNDVTISAYNRLRGPFTERFHIFRKGETIQHRPNLHLLAVGINKYRRYPLDYCVKDAEEMYNLLSENRGNYFEKVKPVFIRDKEASRKRIQDEISLLAESAGPEDVVIIYFSGHGMSIRTRDDRKLFAYIPADYPWQADDETSLKRFGITGDYITARVMSMKPQKVVIIMDCCQSGDIQASFTHQRSARTTNREMLERLANGTGIFLLTSAAGSELARESPPPVAHGLFTYVMLQGLRDRAESADDVRDGVITVKELSRFIDRNFEMESRKIMGDNYMQTPVINSIGRNDNSGRALDFPLIRVK